MEKQKFHSLVDLKDTRVNYITEFDHTQKKFVEGKTINYFFAYPVSQYEKYFVLEKDPTNNLKKLVKIDKQNLDIAFNYIFNFDSKLAPLKQRSEAMSNGGGVKVLEDKYNHCQYFYYIISEFFLKILTGFKHKNLYKINQDKTIDNRNIDKFFGFEGKTKLTNDECIEHSLTICNAILYEFDKIIDILYKKDFDDAIDEALLGNEERNKQIRNKIHDKLKKDKNN